MCVALINYHFFPLFVVEHSRGSCLSRVYKQPVLEMSSSQVPKISSLHDELRDGRGVEGAGYVPPGPSKASTSQR